MEKEEAEFKSNFGCVPPKEYRWVLKKDVKELEKRRDLKPEVCDFCKKKKEDLKFVNEPFCAEIYQFYAPLWMCDFCYEMNSDDI
jgi:hypothetical protein